MTRILSQGVSDFDWNDKFARETRHYIVIACYASSCWFGEGCSLVKFCTSCLWFTRLFNPSRVAHLNVNFVFPTIEIYSSAEALHIQPNNNLAPPFRTLITAGFSWKLSSPNKTDTPHAVFSLVDSLPFLHCPLNPLDPRFTEKQLVDRTVLRCRAHLALARVPWSIGKWWRLILKFIWMWYTSSDSSSDFAAQDSSKTWKVDQATVSLCSLLCYNAGISMVGELVWLDMIGPKTTILWRRIK